MVKLCIWIVTSYLLYIYQYKLDLHKDYAIWILNITDIVYLIKILPMLTLFLLFNLIFKHFFKIAIYIYIISVKVELT